MKKQLRQLLQQRNMHKVAELAVTRHRVLSLLVSLTFDSDPLIAWRAVEAMGAAAERLVPEPPDCIRDHLGRLYWLLNEESGGICWRAPEAMAEIVRRCPEPFQDFIAIIFSLIDEMADEDLDHFRPGVLWAMGRLAPVAPQQLDAVLSTIEACLQHPDAQVRGTAVWTLRQHGRESLIARHDKLRADQAPVSLYEDGRLLHTTVAQLAEL